MNQAHGSQSTWDIAFNIIHFKKLKSAVVKDAMNKYEKICLLASEYKWEELSAVVDGLYRLHGSDAPDVADDLWHIGEHPLQIEIVRQTAYWRPLKGRVIR